MQPHGTVFKRTAIGATMLHANDYVETPEPSRLSQGTLPVIAEFAPVWELYNPRDPKQLLARSFRLYELIQHDHRVQALFDTPIADIKFAGLSFQRYVALLFGIYSNARASILQVPYPTSILDLNFIADSAKISVAELATFAAGKARTLAEAQKELGPLDRATFLTRVRTAYGPVTSWCYVTTHYCSSLTAVLWFSIFNFCSRMHLQVLPGNSYVLWILRRGSSSSIFGERPSSATFKSFLLTTFLTEVPIGKRYGRDGQIDAVVRSGDDVVAFEVKAGFLRDDVKSARDVTILEAALRKKYVADETGRRLGVLQLATSSRAIVNGEVSDITATGTVYPILVGEDPILQVPGVNIYLDHLFHAEIDSDGVGPLTVMLVDELEQLLPHIIAGDIAWQDVVKHRVRHGQMTAEPVHTTLLDLAIERNFRRRPETFLASHAADLMNMINSALSLSSKPVSRLE